MSLIEKIAASFTTEWLTDEEKRTLAQAALTAIMGEGDGVQEVDRIALSDLFDMSQERAMEVFAGHHDDGPLWNKLRALARHRQLAAAAERARRDAEIVAWLRHQDGYGEWQEVADAIERGEV